MKPYRHLLWVLIVLPLLLAPAGTASPGESPAGARDPECGSTTSATSCSPGAACGPSSSCTRTCASPAGGGIAEDPARQAGPPHGIRPAELGLHDLGPLLEEVRTEFKIPGLALALIRNGELTGAGVAGVRRAGGTERIELTDRFHLGSCGKAFTATLAAALVSEGTLAWATTVEDLFPDLGDSPYAKATLGELLAHRSGIPSMARPASPLWEQLSALDGPPADQRRTLVHLAGTQPAVAPPGNRFLYTDLGYAVAGSMLETAAGTSWETLLQTRVAEPLGMTSLGFGAPGGVDPRRHRPSRDVPWGHLHQNGAFTALPPGPGADLAGPSIAPAGTVHSSILDWAAFARLHLRGARGESTPILDPAAFSALHADPYRQGYGRGWMLAEDPEIGRMLMHTGSCGAWAAEIWILPDRNTALVATSNYGGAEAFQALTRAMTRTLAEDLD